MNTDSMAVKKWISSLVNSKKHSKLNMPTINQLPRHCREAKRHKTRTRALNQCTQKFGVCPHVSTEVSKKTNPALRKIAKGDSNTIGSTSHQLGHNIFIWIHGTWTRLEVRVLSFCLLNQKVLLALYRALCTLAGSDPRFLLNPLLFALVLLSLRLLQPPTLAAAE